MSLTIAQVRNDLLSKLGIEDATLAPALALQDVVVAINGAMQFLQTAGERFFTQTEIEVTLGAGTGSYVISAAVQSVIAPVRLNDAIPLRALTSRGELDQFDRIFLGGTDYGSNYGTPVAYWPEFTRNGTTGDIVRITIWLAPIPAADGTLNVQVINDAPSYAVADLSGSTVLPVAQNYTEAIFLPIARMLVTRSSQFSRPDLLAQLTQDYERAMTQLAQNGGFPPAETPVQSRATQG